MKLKITSKFIDKVTGETILPKTTIERTKERGEQIINAGKGVEIKPKAKKEKDNETKSTK